MRSSIGIFLLLLSSISGRSTEPNFTDNGDQSPKQEAAVSLPNEESQTTASAPPTELLDDSRLNDKYEENREEKTIESFDLKERVETSSNDSDDSDSEQEQQESEDFRHSEDKDSIEMDEQLPSAPDAAFEDGEDQKAASCESQVLPLTLEYFSDVTKFQSLFQENVERSLLLVLVHDAGCSYSMDMLEKVQTAAETLRDLQSHLRLGTLELQDPTILKSFGIEKFPTLLFISWVADTDSILFLEYTGLQGTAEDIVATARHYYIRLVFATSGVEFTEEMAHAIPPKFATLSQVRDLLAETEILPLRHPIPHPLPPGLSEPERQYVHFLLQEEQPSEYGKDPNASASVGTIPRFALPDDSVVLLQRRRPANANVPPPDSHTLFDQMSRAISNRRDRFFAIVEDCCREAHGIEDHDDDDGAVLVYSVPYDWDFKNRDFTRELQPHVIRDKWVWQITRWATPSLLWFDRETTAPIVFGLEQKLHAVLVVDMHHSSQPEVTSESLKAALFTRTAVRHFRRSCREFREWACLVVPSTETRVLIGLGVDIWTPLDLQVFEGVPVDHDELLPVMVLTDQRTKGKAYTHVLSHEALRANPDTAVANFFEDFRHNRLQPRVKSDPRGPRTNEAGVRVLTARDMSELDGVSRALVLLVAPTCGHCKRTSAMWNRLSAFLQSVHWENVVSLFRLDVSENDVPAAIAPKWLPDVYYYSNRTYVRLNFPDEIDVDEIDVIDRFLTVANVPDSEISSLLEALERDS